MKKWAPLLFIAIASSVGTAGLVLLLSPDTRIVVVEKPGSDSRDAPATAVLSKAQTSPDGFTEIAPLVTRSVVNIRATASSQHRGSNGSGVIISPDGYIVTCYHVIKNAGQVIVGLPDKDEHVAEVVGVDPTTDLALLKIEARGLHTLTPSDSEEVQIGEWVLAVGNPFNLSSTITAGIVSAKGRNINLINDRFGIEAFIQTDAAVNPGNSGGALVNAKGQLIGVNSAIMSESGSYEGYSFAVPVNLVMKVIADLRDYGAVQRAVLGIGIREIDARFARDKDLATLKGVYVTEVYPNSSAEEAGLAPGDVILGVNKEDVGSISQLQEKLAVLRPGDAIDLEYMRGSKRLNSKEVRLKKLAQY